jgi:glucose/arabinose dehydrogenase
MRLFISGILLIIMFASCESKKQETPVSTDSLLMAIKLPAGFTISVFAEVENARSMALSPAGVVYVGNRNEDKVYAVQDTDGDFVADKKWVLDSGLNMPNGVAFKDGNLYVAEVSRILIYEDIESKLDNPGEPAVSN